MKLNRKHIRKLILKEMAEMTSDMGDASQMNVFSIRLLSGGSAYFMGSQQIPGDKTAAIDTLIENEMTGEMDQVLLARIAQGMGAEMILDENFQEMGMPYKPMPIEQYISTISNAANFKGVGA